MKTHHIANTVLILVLLTAVIGIYYIYKGPGLAIQQPIVKVETLGMCCCQDPDAIVKVPSSLLSTDPDLEEDCMNKCRERGTTTRPVLPLGPC